MIEARKMRCGAELRIVLWWKGEVYSIWDRGWCGKRWNFGFSLQRVKESERLNDAEVYTRETNKSEAESGAFVKE